MHEKLVDLGMLRWVHSIDLNKNSRTYGVADRDYWAWKTKDFANATWQAGIAGFIDWDSKDFSAREKTQIAEAILRGTHFIQRSNGSFEEAYPWESSVCVTGLVLFGLLYSYCRAPELFTEKSKILLLEITKRAIQFLSQQSETHGRIANHQATVLCAKLLAKKVFACGENPSWDELLGLWNSQEGWFQEYTGADPGYQSLLNHYLIALNQVSELPEAVSALLKSSVGFVHQFSFPDGTFAGEVGSRGTSILYPSGTFAPHRTSLTQWWELSYLKNIANVNPTNVDSGNFVPVFNSWALAARLLRTSDRSTVEIPKVTRIYGGAQIGVMESDRLVAAVSFSTGALRRMNKGTAGEWVDQSIVSWSDSCWSTQLGVVKTQTLEEASSTVTLEIGSGRRKQALPNAFNLGAIRVLSFLVYRFGFLQRLLKQLLAFLVMQRRGKTSESIIKITLKFNIPEIQIHDASSSTLQAARFGFDRHMASANTFDRRALQ